MPRNVVETSKCFMVTEARLNFMNYHNKITKTKIKMIPKCRIVINERERKLERIYTCIQGAISKTALAA